MRNVGHGRPGTEVFPTDWAGTHAAVTAKTHTSSVTIGPAATAGTWDPAQRRTIAAPVNPVYDGPADITQVTDVSRVQTIVEDPTSITVFEVELPLTTPADPDTTVHPDAVTPDHVVTITSSPDPLLTGRRLHVRSIERGDRRFARVLLATLID